MTPGAHRLHRQPVPIISLDIPDDICLRAQSLGLDVETFLIASLRAVVAKMEETVKEAAAMKQADPPKLKPGRKPKDAGRVASSWYIERPWHERLKAMANRCGITSSDALNRVLEEAARAGILPPVT